MLEHNLETLRQVFDFVDKGQDCCVVNPCGSGKTSIMEAFILTHRDNSFVVLTKQKNAAEYYKRRSKTFSRDNVKIVTYNKMHRDVQKNCIETYDADFYLIDEAHYLGASMWTPSFQRLVTTYTPRLIGFTATPQRFHDQGTAKSTVTQFFSNNSAGNFTTKDLEEKGVFIEPDYVPSIYDFPNTAKRQKQKINAARIPRDEKQKLIDRLNELTKEWRKDFQPEKLMKRHIPSHIYKPSSNRILVYVSRISSIPDMQKFIESQLKSIFPNTVIKPYIYTHQTGEQSLEEFLRDEDDVYIKVLYSVDKVMETIHIPDLRIMIMLRPSISTRIITQQFGRINNIGNTEKPLVLDMVSNLDTLQKIQKDSQASLSTNTATTDTNAFCPPKLQQLRKFTEVFNTLDGTRGPNIEYRYKDFTGTLKELCFVYGLDYSCARKQSKEHSGAWFVKTMPRVQTSGKTYRDPIETLDTWPILSPEMQQFIEQNMSIVDDHIAYRNIKNDDLKQETYLRYMYFATVAYENNSLPYNLKSAYITRQLALFHLQYLRWKNQRTPEDTVDITECEDLPAPHADPWLPMQTRTLGEYLTDIPRIKEWSITTTLAYMCHYGLDGGQPMTLTAIADMACLSPENIRQRLAKALRQCRHPHIARPLREFSDGLYDL